MNEAVSDEPKEPFRPNRAQRRRKMRNHKFTTKGYTRVIRSDGNGQAFNIPTKVGSRIHRLALKNVKQIHKKRKEEAKRAREQGTDRAEDAPQVSER